MKLSWEPVTLNLKTTFRIAHGADDQRFNVIVHLDEGVGEAPAVTYYNETQKDIMNYLDVLPSLEGDPFDFENILGQLPPGSRSARTAVEVALHDLWGKRLGQPLYRLFGLSPDRIPLTSFTISMDNPEVMAQRAKESGFPIIKIKLGGPDDEAIVRAIRRETSARLRLDANAGWTREKALELIPRLVDYEIEFIEQPLPADDREGLGWLRQKLRDQKVKVPIFADESVKTSHDVASLAGAVDGVVVKLMKSGGIREAMRCIHTARALDMQVMMGCMVETSVGVTAAAHLGSLCDFIDLDGPILIKNDPFDGVSYQGVKLIIPDRPGLGVIRKTENSSG
jgi:L-alanine-DL-glutamate epimerase-like enolase superfamily enzyme